MAQDTVSGNDTEEQQLAKADYDARVYQGSTLYGLQRLFGAGFGPSHVPLRRDNDLVAANFPRVNVRLLSPAFQWPGTVPLSFCQGRGSPTDEVTFDHFVHAIAERHSWLRVLQNSFLSEEGLKFSYIVLSTSSTEPQRKTQNLTKLRIWMQAGIHGNEPAGDQSLLALLGKMDLDPSWTTWILESIDILIFPRCNPDGIAAFDRSCGFGIDLNRDHVKLQMAQSRHIRKLFCEFAPHIAVDMHEYSAGARFGQYVHGSDMMFSAAKNLNIHPGIREISENLFVRSIGQRLEQARFRWAPYVPTNGVSVSFTEAGSDGKIGRNATGLTQCISLLCEVRGIGIGDQHFHRRTATALTFLESLVEIAANNSELVRTTVENAIDEFIGGSEDVVLKDERIICDRTFSLIEINTGKLLELPVQFASATPTTPILTRRRPEAYTIPASMSEVAQRLRASGLALHTTQKGWTGDVQVLSIESAVFDATYYEGVVPMAVTTATSQQVVSLPAGTYIVSTRQKNAALAFIALEPENVDSYVSSNIIPVVAGGEYPIYRLMRRIEM